MRIPMRAIRKIVIVPVAAALGLVALGAPMAHAASLTALDDQRDTGGPLYIQSTADSLCGSDGTSKPTDGSMVKIFINQPNANPNSTADITLTVNQTPPNPLGAFPWDPDNEAWGSWRVTLLNSDGTGPLAIPGDYSITAFCIVPDDAPSTGFHTSPLGTVTTTVTAITSPYPMILTIGCTTTVSGGGFTPGSAIKAYLAYTKDQTRSFVGSATVDTKGNLSINVLVPNNAAISTIGDIYLLEFVLADGTDAVPPVGALVVAGVCPAPPVTPGDVVAAESTVTPDTAVGLLTLGTARQSSGVDSYNIGISLNDKDGNVVTDQAASTLSVANLPVGATAKFTKNADGTFNLFITSTVPGWFPVQVMYTPAGGSTAAIGTPINLAFIGAAVTTDEVPANGSQTVVGYGFQPYEWVVGIVHSNPMQTARVQADVNGKVTISFSVAQLAKGDHTVALQGDKSGITQVVPFTVCQIVSTGGSVVTSSAATTGIVVMLMMVAGLGVAAVRMRRSTL